MSSPRQRQILSEFEQIKSAGRMHNQDERTFAAASVDGRGAGGKIFDPGEVAAVRNRNPTPRLVTPILRRPSSGRRPEVKGTGAVGGGAASSEHVRPVYLEPAASSPPPFWYLRRTRARERGREGGRDFGRFQIWRRDKEKLPNFPRLLFGPG